MPGPSPRSATQPAGRAPLKTPRESVKAARERLLRRGAKLHGVVLNRRPNGGDAMHRDYFDSLYAHHDD
jgi:hypothetical protein